MEAHNLAVTKAAMDADLQQDQPDAPVARRLRITGRVQGVGYRHWACGQARALGLDGFVRNRLDGSVEMLVRGTADAVAAMIVAARQGPLAACVEDVEISAALGLVPAGFVQKPTV